tara:strand:+ start:1337 stop:3142 length:1806 start_codon:yes stop_codon:yes gene_type:complete
MNNIQQLSEECINRIAAGQVIERPASVVKELVENALDADATHIQVRLLEGGKDLIKITDNGKGIGEDDLDLCFKRHTTSKLKSVDELFEIQTNGFRGEALSAIASVSLLDIHSRTPEQDSGYSIVIRDEELKEKLPIAREVGTTIEVRKLFYNSIVNAKFLAGIQTETNKVTDIITRLALIHPSVGFELYHDTKEIIRTRVGRPEARISEILGPKVARHMIPIDYQSPEIAISGYIGAAEISKGRRSGQYLYIENRPIWNGSILRAIDQGFQTFHPGRYPVYVLNIELNRLDYDVNVHPTKREVRFSNEKSVFSRVSKIIRETLREYLETQHRTPLTVIHSDTSVAKTESGETSTSDSKSFAKFDWDHLLVQEGPKEIVETTDLFDNQEASVDNPSLVKFPKPDKSQTTPEPFMEKALFFQWHKQYILFETSNGLMIVDQYLAHSRVLFEQAYIHLEEHSILSVQQLLFPELLEVNPEQNFIIEENRDRFEVLGYDLQEFGKNTWHIRGIPATLKPNRAIESLENILTDIEHSKNEDIRLNLAIAWGRSNAIPRGQRLNYEEMAQLVNQLFLTENPHYTPQGKSIFIRLTLEELANKFTKG